MGVLVQQVKIKIIMTDLVKEFETIKQVIDASKVS